MDRKDWAELFLGVWTNIIATAALIVSLTDKKKTAKRKPAKHKRKR